MPNLFLQLRDDTGDEREPVMSLSEAAALDVLEQAEIGEAQLIPWGSNYSFAVALEMPTGGAHLAIYKPRAGEAPLYDFPDGTLYLREVAAYRLSRWLGWDIVPPTTVREGPHGAGSLQLYVQPGNPVEDEYAFWGQTIPEIERLVLFDHITNNADRKIGHCLRDQQGKLWGIDHGLTFNEEPKLRTVLWQFANAPVSEAMQADLSRILAEETELRAELAPFLDESELDAFFSRSRLLLARACYPRLNPRRNVPYGWW